MALNHLVKVLGIVPLVVLSIALLGCSERAGTGDAGSASDLSSAGDSTSATAAESLETPERRTIVYDCSSDAGASVLVTARVGRESAEVWLPEQFASRHAVLVPAVSASGARYSGDGIVLSTRGEREALVEIDGVEYENCVENRVESIWADARLRGVTVRAVGNEPGWLLEITDGGLLHLTYDYGEGELAVPAPEPEVDEAARVATYHATADDVTVRVEVEDLTCIDNMSGFEFEKTVTVELGERTFYGCGRGGLGGS